MKTMIWDHLHLLSKNFGKYFLKSLNQDLENEIWVINPFIADHLKQSNFGELIEKVMELQRDFSERASFKTYFYGFHSL